MFILKIPYPDYFLQQKERRYGKKLSITMPTGLRLSENALDYVSIDKTGIERFLLQQNWCRDRKKDLFCTLRQFYTFCALPSPAGGIYFAVDKSQKLPKLPARGRILRIIEKIDGCDDELITRNRLLVELAYGSGLRRKELCLLNVEDIDLAGRCAHVSGKGSKPRVVLSCLKIACNACGLFHDL
ncbi:MAG: tyrosine-type recombinase/integrase [Chitinivibrionales bacterium]|nr:tyrosine-type recombinase/integrase [Chitinivibrionales bacterium]